MLNYWLLLQDLQLLTIIVRRVRRARAERLIREEVVHHVDDLAGLIQVALLLLLLLVDFSDSIFYFVRIVA